MLGRGVSLDPVPGISYYSIAGTKPYAFMERLGLAQALFGGEPNDGLVAVSSTQRFGETVIDDKCVNFWSSPTVHTELNDDPYIYQLVGQIVTSDISKQLMKSGRESTLFGYTDHIRLNVEGCSPGDTYIVVGKKAAAVEREAYCACGNGICDGLEDEVTCPEDCLITEKPFNVWWVIAILTAICTLGMFAIIAIEKARETETLATVSAKLDKLWGPRMKGFILQHIEGPPKGDVKEVDKDIQKAKKEAKKRVRPEEEEKPAEHKTASMDKPTKTTSDKLKEVDDEIDELFADSKKQK